MECLPGRLTAFLQARRMACRLGLLIRQSRRHAGSGELATEPHWEKLYRGRLEYELADLRSAGAEPVVDQQALAAGRLVLSFQWPLGEKRIALRAVYPDAFPHLKPIVYLAVDRAEWPVRHVSPVDGNICLLGRDTKQWVPSWTLRKLLDEQLADALSGTGTEDPQGEPAEFWWNSIGRAESYVLVNSDWNVGAARCGSVQMVCAIEHLRPAPLLKAAAVKLLDDRNVVLAEWPDAALPAELKSASALRVEVPWQFADSLPAASEQSLGVLAKTSEASHHLKSSKRQRFGSAAGPPHLAQLFAFAYEAELQWQKAGLSWLFMMRFGGEKVFRHGKASHMIIPTLRAGPIDIGWRVPSVGMLKDKTIAVIGLGALGAHIAIDLARNCARQLRLMEFDAVEPGNSIRWPLGASAWGRPKLASISEFITREYPWTDVQPTPHHLGTFGGEGGMRGDRDALTDVLAGADLAIDATASYGVTTSVADACRERNIPLIALFATPSVHGGAVVRFGKDGGCPVCLEHAMHSGQIAPPPGFGEEAELSQPPGCAERTFAGASFDLQELSLQAMRLAAETLRDPTNDRNASVAHIVSFVDEGKRRVPPTWRTAILARRSECRCDRR